jgi:hypothetical protein
VEKTARMTKHIAITFALFLLMFALFTDVPAAQAGVLISSGRVTSGIGFNFPRARLYRAKKSTVAMRATNPTLAKRNVWGAETELKMQEDYYKYQRKLYQWELKRQRTIEKDLRKKQKKEEALEKKLKKQAELEKRKQEKRTKMLAKEGKDSNAPEGKSLLSDKNKDKTDNSSADKGKIGKGQKPTFWSRLKKALFGGL